MNHRTHLHSVHLPVAESGVPYLWFESLTGEERINDLFCYRLVVKTKDAFGRPAHGIHGLEGYVSKEAYQDSLVEDSEQEGGSGQGGSSGTVSYHSPASHLDVISLIGTPLGVSIDLNDLNPLDAHTITGQVSKHGLVASITQLTTHHRHATYEVVLVPWLWLLTKTNNYRIYQNQSIPSILEDVLSHYPYAYELRLSHHYPALDYQTQYDESDYAFVTRLMAEHGLNFYFEHEADTHCLIITDSNSHFKTHSNPFYQSLTLYPPEQRMPEYAEYLEHFHPTQSLVVSQSLVTDYQFKSPSTALMGHDSHPWDTAHNQLQRYEWAQGRRADEAGLGTLAANLAQSYHQQGLRAYGQGQLKGLQVGRSFRLQGHPQTDSNIDWLILSMQMTIKALDADKQVQQYYTADTRFSAQPLTQTLKPDALPKRPVARTQTAVVVSPVGEEIHTDAYGRIKVKFHWDRPSLADRQILDNRLSTERGGETEAGSEAHINTCWLRLASMWSGNHYGSISLPRVGQEVIIDFFGGNPDMPYIAGTLNNPEQMPIWELPGEKVLSGIRSKEYQGDGANQLVMDDSTGKLQTQLKSDHLHSELNLGHITRIDNPKGRGEHRGEGFELRSDGHGVIRADRGMVISTHGRKEALGYVKDISETTNELEAATSQHEAQLQSAIDALCEDRSIDDTLIPALTKQNQMIKGVGAGGGDSKENGKAHPELANPQIAISSLAGIAMTARQSIHLVSQDGFGLTTDKDISMASQHRLSVTAQQGIRNFSYSGGIRHYAHKDDIELQAQEGQLKHIARQDIHITSTEGKIHITSPKELSIKVAGSELKINEQGVFITTPQTFRVKSNEKEMVGGEYVGFGVPRLPEVKNTNAQFQFVDDDNIPYAHVNYTATYSNGRIIKGVTDENGFTQIFFSTSEQEINVHLDL